MKPSPSLSGQASAASIGAGPVPLFQAAWLFAVGIAATEILWLQSSLVLAALPLVAVLCCLAAWRAQRIVWLPMALLWLLLGAWCAQMEPHPAPSPALAALSDNLLRTAEGTIVEAGQIRGERELNLDETAAAESPSQRIDLRLSSLEVVTDNSDVQTPIAGGARLNLRWPADASSPTPFHCGERIRAIVRLLPPENYHDPGVWSHQDFLAEQGITSTASVTIDRVERLGQEPGLFLACRVSGLQHATSVRLLALPAAMHRLPAPLRLSEDDAIMLAAMVTGDRTYLTHSLRVGFERTGSFHMLVVSGFHLAIVAGCIFWITRRLRLPRVPATLVTILASLAYALFTGFATPVQRSLWMVALYLLGRLVYRERNVLNTIGFAALCLLAYSPRSLFDSSFQMTLLAVVSIGGVAAPLLACTIHPYLTATRDLGLTELDTKLAPRLAQFRVTLRMFSIALDLDNLGRKRSRKRSPKKIVDETHQQFELFENTMSTSASGLHAAFEGRLATFIAWRCFPFSVCFLLRVVELLVVSCVVELAMTLPMAIYFHRITIFALPVNLFVLPLLAVLIPSAITTLLVALIWPVGAAFPAAITAIFLHFGTWLVHFFGSLTWGDFRISTPLVGQSLAFCALFALAVALAHLALLSGALWPRRAALTALLLAAVAAVLPRPLDHPHDALLVEAIDVGQGDSLLLITPDGKTLLVDGGGIGGGFGGRPRQTQQEFDIGEEVVSQALWTRGIRHLDVVALSHAHSDHMGGLPAVLRNFHPSELWAGNNPPAAPYLALLDEAASLHIQVRSWHAGDAFAFGPTQVNVLAPFRDYQPGADPANNDSLVLRVAYGATSVLLEGDAEAPIEEAMLAEPGLASTLLKVGHHGSLTSTQPEFLARVAPKLAVISCGLRNHYGHPRQEVLYALEAAHVHTFSTDIHGYSCFRLDGTTAVPDASCGWRPAP
jgi:competence protein ComEC